MGVIVATTMIVVLLVPISVLRILISGHRRSLSLPKPAGMAHATRAVGIESYRSLV
jgi:hypothetical protein